MINGRRVHPLLAIAIVVVVGYLVLGQLAHYALFPVVIALVAWGGYLIFKAERGNLPPTSPRRPTGVRQTRRARKSIEAIRFDPNEDLRVPKDWR